MDSKITHDEMVKKLLKPGAEILASMTPEKMTLLHCASKLVCEAGELLDAVCKHCYYEQPIDRENVIEEDGDISFYLSGIRDTLNYMRSTAIQSNMTKLGKRYPNFEYTNQRAKERADKIEYLKVSNDGTVTYPANSSK